MRKVVAVGLLLSLLSHCAGHKGVLKLEELKYPASFSGYIYDKDFKPVRIEGGLKKLSTVRVARTGWSMLYGFTKLSDSARVIDDFNSEVEKAGGQGVVNLEIAHSDCFLNSLFPLTLLPFWVGCSKIEVSGDVVAPEK